MFGGLYGTLDKPCGSDFLQLDLSTMIVMCIQKTVMVICKGSVKDNI